MHGIRGDSGIVPNKGLLWVGRISPDLLVRVPEGTTDSLGVTNLGAWLKEVLSLENILRCELAEILLGGNLAGEKRGRKTCLLYTSDAADE